jgi:hypothetical protein
MSGLLVNCGPDHNGQIAVMIVDDHGRMGIFIVYETLDEYFDAYVKWQEQIGTDIMPTHVNFSKQIVLDRRLPTYYG